MKAVKKKVCKKPAIKHGKTASEKKEVVGTRREWLQLPVSTPLVPPLMTAQEERPLPCLAASKDQKLISLESKQSSEL